ncbi:MAG: hypothetical protein HY540_04980 [Deltaproteobacteria bacterium]|nr:hypothetical protein [Deltaproteobacteria bacterium]
MNCSISPADDQHESYSWHTLGRQLSPVALIPLATVGAVGQFRINYSIAHLDPTNEALHGFWRQLYEPSTRMGRAFQRFYLPPEFHTDDPHSTDLRALHQNGNRLQTFSSVGLNVSLGIRAVANIAAISQNRCQQGSMTPAESAAVYLDTASLGSRFVEAGTYNKGLFLQGQELDDFANRWFRSSHKIAVGSGALQVVAGGLRLYRGLSNPQNSLNEIAYAAIDTANGAANTLYSVEVLVRDALAKSSSEQNVILRNIIKQSLGLNVALKAVGAAGAGFGLFLNGKTFYEASTNAELTADECLSMKVSSVIGGLGNLGLLIGGIAVVAGAAPVAAAATSIGFAFMVGQSIYENWDGITGLVGRLFS